MSKQPIPVLLDGDPGHDDAMAWMLAAASPALKILSVTSCSGRSEERRVGKECRL